MGKGARVAAEPFASVEASCREANNGMTVAVEERGAAQTLKLALEVSALYTLDELDAAQHYAV
eukprot:CAMPEP_0185839356 /NCGR_PEP_ID=MMETSP1353-20130828/14466_1 /TAXON_ID=1077150 /ORGANISM="Erythrolobus australicus, Strain CCMP3124" /LENGTH=62 /DNA_ID=CAMNT_0028538505 /DNA_START=166 /DNA_END=351 /DNA_ORIENTATION=+